MNLTGETNLKDQLQKRTNEMSGQNGTWIMAMTQRKRMDQFGET
jgi:hypothetical protein